MQEKKIKVKFHTLGCKLNFSETSTLARMFAEEGFERAEAGDKDADIHVINTCSVTDTADKKCRYLIRKITRENSGAIIAVTGCYAQLKPREIADIDGVDIVIGNNSKGSILDLVREVLSKGKKGIYTCEAGEITSFFSSFSSGDRTRAFLKVQDGCSYHCSYCTIPLARGESRNIPIADIVREAEEIAKGGHKEIVLTGVNIGDFGKTTGERFIDLIKRLDKVEGIERYRISSIEPNLLSEEIIKFTHGSDKFQPHFHIPLQSGNDRILGLMRRRYTSGAFREKTELLRKYEPDAFIGIDVIVGFPGETEEDFMVTYNFLKDLEPSFLHIFPYSERANTDAAGFDGSVPQNIRNERVERLGRLSDELYAKFCKKFIGKPVKVLIEGRTKGEKMFGHTENYLRVELPYEKDLVNTVVETVLTEEMLG